MTENQNALLTIINAASRVHTEALRSDILADLGTIPPEKYEELKLWLGEQVINSTLKPATDEPAK